MQVGQDINIDNQTVSLEKYLALERENRQLQSDNLYLKQELFQLKRMIFGSKSERYIPSAGTGQLSLDLGVNDGEPPKQETEEISYTRKKTARNDKNKPVRMPLPPHLHREVITIEPEGDMSGAKKIGEEITEILEYTPGKLYVEKYVRPKYALPEDKGVSIGELPSFPIPKGNAGAGVLSHLLISKFVDHLPFYRQVQQFKRQEVVLAESTINGWFTSACRLLAPLYDTLVKKVRQCSYIMADETPIKVLTSQKPGSTHKGYHWVYYSPLEKLVCFDYQKGRGREGPEGFLEGFKGTLQADGYGAYDIYEKKQDIILLACMAHVRRKFYEAKDNDIEKAEYVLKKIKLLYNIEKKARELELGYGKRKYLREQEAVPIIEELEGWLKEHYYNIKRQQGAVLPKSAIGKAICYAFEMWARIKRYINDGRYEIDNNLVENSIRPVAIGRKNYLFAGSHEGARQAAMMYSFLGTCKLNGVEPYKWLKDTLNKIQDHSILKLDELLPNKQML